MRPVTTEMVNYLHLFEHDLSGRRQRLPGRIPGKIVNQPVAALPGMAANGLEVFGRQGDFHGHEPAAWLHPQHLADAERGGSAPCCIITKPPGEVSVPEQ
jgi:hypothetical protein